jgi:hypothetical protein
MGDIIRHPLRGILIGLGRLPVFNVQSEAIERLFSFDSSATENPTINRVSGMPRYGSSRC